MRKKIHRGKKAAKKSSEPDLRFVVLEWLTPLKPTTIISNPEEKEPVFKLSRKAKLETHHTPPREAVEEVTGTPKQWAAAAEDMVWGYYSRDRKKVWLQPAIEGGTLASNLM